MPELGSLRRPIGSSPEDAVSDEDGVIDNDNVPAFRISVDLSEYFQQHASCFLWVPRPRDTRTVRWLARRLRQAAALRERFCLLCDTHTLPPEEPLRILRPGDSLRVVRVKHEWQRVFSFRGERAPAASPPKAKKRRKINTVEAEPQKLPLTKPTLELASVSKPKPSLPPPLLPPFSLPTSWPVMLPKSVECTTPSVPITKPPSQDEELQRVKSRALALLQKVEGKFSRGKERDREGAEDETDGAGNEWPPAKKRRHRVRRRRALPPIDFEQELLLSTTKASEPVLPATPELSLTAAIPTTPVTVKPYSITTPSYPTHPSIESPAVPAPSFPTQPSILSSPIPVPSLSSGPPPDPVVLREETTPRLPRLIRALDNMGPEIVPSMKTDSRYYFVMEMARSGEIDLSVSQLRTVHQNAHYMIERTEIQELNSASTAPALPQTAVQCN